MLMSGKATLLAMSLWVLTLLAAYGAISHQLRKEYQQMTCDKAMDQHQLPGLGSDRDELETELKGVRAELQKLQWLHNQQASATTPYPTNPPTLNRSDLEAQTHMTSFSPTTSPASFEEGLSRITRVRREMMSKDDCKVGGSDPCWEEGLEGSGLSEDMLQRSRKHVGNVHRLRNWLRKLWSGEPTTVMIIGGSNCGGGGRVNIPNTFPERLARFLNAAFPLAEKKHQVVNNCIQGTGSCPAAQMVEIQLDAVEAVDLVIAEFAVNDGLEQSPVYVSPPFSSLYAPVRGCVELVVRKVLDYKQTVALVFLELASFHTRWVGSGSQADITDLYGIPHLSWRDAVIPAMQSRAGRFADYEPIELLPCVWQTHGMQKVKC